MGVEAGGGLEELHRHGGGLEELHRHTVRAAAYKPLQINYEKSQ